MLRIIYAVVLISGISVVFSGCRSSVNDHALFSVLDSSATGIRFANRLRPAPEFNLFSYMYYYNGAGIGAGDFNNDGLTDLYFAASQRSNALYLNRGNLQFEDVSARSGIPEDSSWSTGVSVVDINNDGLQDIYVCQVGRYKVLQGRNRLLVCDSIDDAGIPHYTDRAAAYGLDFSGFSTQAAFLDADGDGDLDMFLLNHSVNHDGNYAPRDHFLNTYDSLAGQRFYRNDSKNDASGKRRNYFSDVTRQSGINGSRIGYGLGVAVSDINLDGWPDIYVGNDFHEDDYLYINQRNGTFREENRDRLNHTSQFSMGVDVADINNDAYPEIVSMDMLPYDPYMLRRSIAEDDYNIFEQKITYGYTHQYARNNLQLNRGNGRFSEIGQYSGIHATDWSWAAMWMDFNNDGSKDLFVSNGIPKRMNDIDYIQFVSGDDIQQKLRTNTIRDQDLSLTNKFPEIKIPNQFFLNRENLQFANLTDSIPGNRPTFSNGAVYADLDNDGDLDIVVNNIDDPTLIYLNNTNSRDHQTAFSSLHLTGPPDNMNAVGATVLLYSKGKVRTYERQPVHGFLSSMMVPLHIGLDHEPVDSALLIWPDRRYQRLELHAGRRDTLVYEPNRPLFDFARFQVKPALSANGAFTDITAATELNYQHRENIFNEFNRESLMPLMMSTEGPAIAVADINHDGTDDVFAGSSKGYPATVWVQNAEGKFRRTEQPALQLDSMWEHVDAVWTDVNKDQHPDLLIATGGNEYYASDEHQQPLLYLNDGSGKLTRKPDAFPGIYGTFSKVAVHDFNGDGNPDLFIGGRAEPWKYGITPRSYLLKNNGSGQFTDVTAGYGNELRYPGLITDAHWIDLDANGFMDLLLSAEWGGIDAYLFNGKSFTKTPVTDWHGWWRSCIPADADGDGDLDIIAGNFGLNSRLKASPDAPVRLYVHDFDDNGNTEQIMTYYLGGEEICFSGKAQLEKRMPVLKKQFLYAEDFAKTKVKDLFGQSKLSASHQLFADHFATTVFLNDGNLRFRPLVLPDAAQFSTVVTAVSIPGSKPAWMLAGNFYAYNVEIGRQDAHQGLMMQINTRGDAALSLIPGLTLQGQVRKIIPVVINKRQAYILAKHNDTWQVIEQKTAQ